jgi:hypothetical protein
MNDTPVTDAFFYKKGCWSEDILAFCRRLERERDEARQQYDDLATEHVLAVNKFAEERDEARADAAKIADILSGLELRTTEELARLERERNEWSAMCGRYKQERDEAQKELSSIHRWIDKNHADGFIDSLTYLQNLERVVDNWYDRIDAIEADARRFVRERDEARNKYDALATEHMLVVNKLCEERDKARAILSEIANASHFDNIGNWARNKAKKALEDAK